MAWDSPLQGRVVDENGAPVREARVHVGPAGGSANAYEAETDPTGVFTIALPEPGDVLITVERDGYYTLKDYPANIGGPQELRLMVNSVREVFQSVNVDERTSPVDIGRTQSQQRLSGAEVNDIPYANSHSLLSSLLSAASAKDSSRREGQSDNAQALGFNSPCQYGFCAAV